MKIGTELFFVYGKLRFKLRESAYEVHLLCCALEPRTNDKCLTKYSANCVGVPPSIVRDEKWSIRIVREQMRAVRVITLCFRSKYDKKFNVKSSDFRFRPLEPG